MERQSLAGTIQARAGVVPVRTRIGNFLGLFLLSLAVYWPAFDNGFISDDYILLERVDAWPPYPLRLLEASPDPFRSTIYAVFRALKRVAGYRPWCFYLFAVGLHAVNGFLLGALTARILGDRSTGWLASVLFVALQNPQEAVMWLAAVNEALLGFFVLLSLWLWIREHRIWSLVAYCLALVSKESAPVLLLLMPLVEAWRKRKFLFSREYGYFWIVSLGFGLIFVLTLSTNHLVAQGFYSLGSQAFWVFINSLHRLAFPWLYLLAAVVLFGPLKPPARQLGGALAWTALSLGPYLFLTYQDHVPSRHAYLASMGLAVALAVLARTALRTRLLHAFLALFLSVNIGYIWLVKDAQFEERAAPTTRLIEAIENRSPIPIRVVDYPLNPWTAKLVTRLLPGWEPDLIKVNQPPEACPSCPTLCWDRANLTFRVEETESPIESPQ